jgi:stage V sporulation protein B
LEGKKELKSLHVSSRICQAEEREGVMAKGTFYQLISGVIFVVSGYIIHIGLGRHLGPELYGVFGVILSLLGINYLFLLSGVRDSVSKFTAQDPVLAHPILKQGLKVQGALSLTLAFLYFGLSSVVANWLNDASLIQYIRLSALAIPLTAMYTAYLGSLNGMRFFGKEAVIKAIYSIAKVFLVFAFVFLGFQISGAICGYILAALVALLVARYICKFEKTPASFDYKRIIKFATPIIIFSGVATLLTNLDLLFVKAILQDNSQAGLYTAASNLTRTPLPIFYAFSLTLFPAIAKSTLRKDLVQTQTHIKSSLRYLTMLLIPVAFLISATSKDLIELFYSSKFSSAGEPLSILIFGMSFFSVFTLLVTIINASGRPAVSMIFAIIIIPVSVVLNLILIPAYQLVGAAMATSISILFGVLIAGSYVYTKYRTLLNFSSLLKILSASLMIFMIAIICKASGSFLLVEYVILLNLYFLLLYFFKAIIQEDIEKGKVILKMIIKR